VFRFHCKIIVMQLWVRIQHGHITTLTKITYYNKQSINHMTAVCIK